MKKKITYIALLLSIAFMASGCAGTKSINGSNKTAAICIYSGNESFEKGQKLISMALDNNKQKDVLDINQKSSEYWSKNIDNIHFVKIDSNLYLNKDINAAGENQLKWLRDDLNKNKNAKWKILIMQHAFFTTSIYKKKEARRIYAAIEPSIRAYKIDAIVSGELHAYERMDKNSVLSINLNNSDGKFDGINDYKVKKNKNYKIVTGKLELLKIFNENGKLKFQAVAIGKEQNGNIQAMNQVVDNYEINKD